MEYFLSAFVTLLVLIDPLGTAAVYAALTAQRSEDEARSIAKKASLVALGVLLFFACFGAVLIHLMGISLEAFRIAGGLLLFTIAFRMLMGHNDHHTIVQEKSVYSPAATNAGGDVAVFPLAIPLLSGPGCMTAMILLSNQTPGWSDRIAAIIAMLCVVAISYFCMRGVAKITATFGPGGIQIIARLMGILLAALAVQFIADGIKLFIHP